ncbi:diacetyl reductase [Podospora conica]|nr:diacetyl reductase [Schizothecium conicum]
MASKSFFAVIAGVGPGTGRSVALKFAKTYPVALLARKPESYADIVAEITQSGGQAIGISTDTSDAASVTAAFAKIRAEYPDKKLAAAIYNVGAGFSVRPFLDLAPSDLSASLSNATGLFNFAQATLPGLLEAVETAPSPPTLVVTGATASLRGAPRFAAFAAGKFAVRALAQSLAREFHPRGVHVAHVIVDGVIDIPATKGWEANGGAVDGKISADAIADSYWYLHTQHRSSFTQELDLRPYVEKF